MMMMMMMPMNTMQANKCENSGASASVHRACQRSGKISRSSLSSIYGTSAHRSAPLIWLL